MTTTPQKPQQSERRKFVEPEEITCTVTSISYSKQSAYSEDKHFMILIARIDNKGFKCLGEADPGSVITNCEYRMSGNWVDDPSFGRQFKFKSFAIREPPKAPAMGAPPSMVTKSKAPAKLAKPRGNKFARLANVKI